MRIQVNCGPNIHTHVLHMGHRIHSMEVGEEAQHVQSQRPLLDNACTLPNSELGLHRTPPNSQVVRGPRHINSSD